MGTYSFKSMFFKKGFSLLELIIVVGIMAILGAITIFSLISMNNAELVSRDVFQVRSLLDRARSQTLSAKDDSQYGVHFTQTSVTLFKGSAYSPSDPENYVFNLDDRVLISSFVFSGQGNDVVFYRLTGETSVSGTVTFILKKDPSKTKTITISKTGIIQSN